ncbi:hypothetical protein FRIGORI9N_470191 [Frigoribacterium sp. 9N]|nr:hypothetical protein FRIGORI9N_470191 [Frigoribacterium sp. 9N]
MFDYSGVCAPCRPKWLGRHADLGSPSLSGPADRLGLRSPMITVSPRSGVITPPGRSFHVKHGDTETLSEFLG